MLGESHFLLSPVKAEAESRDYSRIKRGVTILQLCASSFDKLLHEFFNATIVNNLKKIACQLVNCCPLALER